MGTLAFIALAIAMFRLVIGLLLQRSPNPPNMKTTAFNIVNDMAWLIAGGLVVYYE